MFEGVFDSVFGKMFEGVFDSVFVALPLLLIGVLVVLIGGAFFAYSRRIGPFYWVESYKAPYVYNIEGERVIAVSGGDSFKKTMDGPTIYLESKIFGDKFVANHLMDLLEYTQGGTIRKKETTQILPIIRLKPNVWTRLEFVKEYKEGAETAKASPSARDVQDAHAALAVMRAGSKAYLGENFWDKWAPLISSLMLGVLFLLALIVITQYTTAVFNGHIAAMNANTEALIRLVNATTHCNPSPTPRLPIG
jgi:hypothetical protein